MVLVLVVLVLPWLMLPLLVVVRPSANLRLYPRGVVGTVGERVVGGAWTRDRAKDCLPVVSRAMVPAWVPPVLRCVVRRCAEVGSVRGQRRIR